MAAVGCSPIERVEMGDKNGSKLTVMCRKNGLKHGCYWEELSETRNKCRSQLVDKFIKINGSVNNNSFTKPSIPTLRSLRERHSSGPDGSKRRRRSSRHDSGDTNAGEPPPQIQENGHPTPDPPDTPGTPDSLEVAAINCSGHSSTEGSNCNSVPITKDITNDLLPKDIKKELLPLVSGNGLVPVAPGPSRTCTPFSLGITPSTSGNNTPSTVPQAANCQWRDCDKSVDNGEIMEHIRTCHVLPQSKNETCVCLWKGCKVFNKTSSSKSWLDRHILSHSGDKPFRCIVAKCGARFTSQGGLERHVNSHFSALEQSPNSKHSKHGREDTPTKLFKRKKLKKQRIGAKTEDYFDSCIMERVQDQLNAIADRTDIDLNGSTDTVTFHSTVIARRTEESGKTRVLLHWTPADVLQDDWVLESRVPHLQTCSIPVNRLPRDTVYNLHPSLYQQHRHRKHRRK